jgi:hypothetical protein
MRGVDWSNRWRRRNGPIVPMAPMSDSKLNARDRPDFVLPETTILAILGCVDLLWTIYLLATGQAFELNPLFSSILSHVGTRGFVAVKAAYIAGPLIIAELARREHPEFVRKALRVAIALYVGIYALGYVRYNLHH